MLTVYVPEGEAFDEVNNLFIKVKAESFVIEHSLVSIAKWESKWHQAFLGKQEKTREQTIDYIRCMCITQHVDTAIFSRLTDDGVNAISDYIDDSMTATWFAKNLPNGRSVETVTAELIYYWMISLNIPFECQKWHLNRLITLIKVCNVKNTPPKKGNRRDILAKQRALNTQRKTALNTKG